MTKLETRPTDRETREERAEAAEHRSEESKHRREAEADRAEAAADRREGDRLEAAGNELEAKTHDLAASGHSRAARHDEREAAEAGRADVRAAATPPVGAASAGGGGPASTGVTAGATPPDTTPAGAPRSTATDGNGHALFGKEQQRRFRSRWDDVQSSFIDEPREAVAEADALVREATDALHSIFERDRRQLEGAWDRGDEVSTEDLRVTLQRYRSFFERVLTI